jgi:hypothetical protein
MDPRARTITEPTREVEVVHRTEVLVAGSGPRGLATIGIRDTPKIDAVYNLNIGRVQAEPDRQGVRRT